MTKQMNITKVREGLGLKKSEMSALLGNNHNSQIQMEKNHGHNRITETLYWLIRVQGVLAVSLLLDRWLFCGPKDQTHGRQLMRIAKRFKSKEDYIDWVDRFKAKYPNGF